MHRDYYTRNKTSYIERIRNRRARLRIELDALKAAPCADCGKRYPPYVMDFDHRDPTKKAFSIAHSDDVTTSMRRLLSEIAKCDLVCANCHRERTYGSLGSRLTVGQRPLKP
jgi:hypothetical protein